MIALFLAAAVGLPAPSPSATPLKEIKHVTSSAFCTAFQENVKHSVEGVLLNDDLFRRSESVFAKIARDMYTSPLVSHFNQGGAAGQNGDDPRVTLDMNRLRELGASVVHNLQVIDALLSDAQRFPASVSSDEMKQLLALRAHVLEIAKTQNQELNVISGTADEYMMDSLMSQDVSFGGALSSNGKPPPDNGVLGGGPLALSKAQAGDPQLLQNSTIMNSAAGTIYRNFMQTEAAEGQLEQSLAPLLTQAAKRCAPAP